MTTNLCQKGDDRPTFFPPPLFEPEVRRTSAVTLPIRCETLPEDEIELLSWEDIVASEDQAEQFIGKITEYAFPAPIPEGADIAFRYHAAYELLTEARNIIGTAGIRHFCDWLDRFDKEIVV